MINKRFSACIITFFLLTIIIPLSTTQGQKSGEITSYAFIDVAPNPIGVGQTSYISIFVDIALPESTITNDIRRENYTLTITKPDGTMERLYQ